jgi:hypothetical protein
MMKNYHNFQLRELNPRLAACSLVYIVTDLPRFPVSSKNCYKIIIYTISIIFSDVYGTLIIHNETKLPKIWLFTSYEEKICLKLKELIKLNTATVRFESWLSLLWFYSITVYIPNKV